MNREYENGYPSQRMIYKLAEVLGVNRNAISFNDDYGVSKSIIYYKSSIANRSIETFCKFLMYSKVDVDSFTENKIIIKQSKK